MICAFEKRLIFVLFNFTARWDRKNNPEPWNNMEPNQQYKVRAFASLFAQISSTVLMHLIHFDYLYDPLVRLKRKAYVCGARHVSPPLSCVKVHNMSLTPIVLLCVFVFSSSQLTWTTPSWRRTGLISESSCLCSITRGAFALSSQIQTCDTEWSLNPTVLHSFSQLILQCGDRDH